jgi:phosphate transport system substrate-binding protein
MKIRSTTAIIVCTLLDISHFECQRGQHYWCWGIFPCSIYSKWADGYHKATGNEINYQSIGSGGGIKQIKSKTVDFGASDMPLSDDELNKDGLMQFPTVIGGVVPVVHIKVWHQAK